MTSLSSHHCASDGITGGVSEVLCVHGTGT